MAPKDSHTDKIPVLNPATALAGGLARRTPTGVEGWALIRYVGTPIGELVHLRGENLSIGRASDNGLFLPEPEVSRRHAMLHQAIRPDGTLRLELEDLGSTNGTLLNGRRLQPNGGRAPLRHGDVILVGPHAFKLKRLDELELYYHQTVLAQTTLDPLTELSNRTTVLDYLEKHFDLAQRHNRPLSVLLCDIDHFKLVNDHFGHAAGDLVLHRFASILMNRLRGSDQGGRIGGEEFLVVLPETQDYEALRVAEDLRQAVEAESMLSVEGREVRLTCSLGVAQAEEGDGNGGVLLARADVALYRAKSLGRNRVEGDLQP